MGTADRCPLGVEMDSSHQAAVNPRDREVSVAAQRQRRSIAEKRRIVEETLAPGASVARVARAHGVNANQVFGWRRLYLAGLGEAQRSRSRSLSARSASASPTSHQPHRGLTALEHRLHSSGRVQLTSSWTLSNTVHGVRLRNSAASGYGNMRLRSGKPSPAKQLSGEPQLCRLR